MRCPRDGKYWIDAYRKNSSIAREKALIKEANIRIKVVDLGIGFLSGGCALLAGTFALRQTVRSSCRRRFSRIGPAEHLDSTCDPLTVTFGIRARYRSADEREDFPMPGKTDIYAFDRMTFFARTIVAGHRLQLVVDTPSSVYDQRNYNSGGEVARETLSDARATNVVVTEGGPDAARIELPLADSGS